MNTYPFQCGYIIPALRDALIEEEKDPLRKAVIDKDSFKQLTQFISSFEISSDHELLDVLDNASPIAMVIHNILIRGEPTFLPIELEEKFAERLAVLKEGEKLGAILHEYTGSPDLLQTCWNAFHLIEPRITRASALKNYQKSWEQLDSRCEENFLYKDIPQYLFGGQGDLLIQLFQPQRSLDSMVQGIQVNDGLRQNFREQRADFVCEFPYGEKRGICLEVDGPHHHAENQKYLDQNRDRATLERGWVPTFRFPVEAIGSHAHTQQFGKVQKALLTPYVEIIQSNYQKPLYESPEGRVALQLALSPFAIARVQLVIVRAILSGCLKLDAEAWRIAVRENDVPCAHLAMANLQQLFGHLLLLQGKGQQLPEIDLQVYNSKEFDACELNETFPVFPQRKMGADTRTYDLFIDISMLARSVWDIPRHTLKATTTVVIHSGHYREKSTKILCGDRIAWQAVWDTENKTQKEKETEALTYILQNIFRKKAFRTGQLPILNHAIQNRTVIGLLPTGGGKSLTYQIASFLQPGLVLVIDPIKSLMKDQVDGLIKNGITRCVYINSSLKTFQERKAAMDRMKNGEALFCFISPERLQIQTFRNYLWDMYEAGLYFTYGVIDEVHCVSEWGHNFRTSYLSLGENLLRHCKAKSGNIALFGLTATASFDVLADVQRELGGNDPKNEIPDDQIVRHETTNRDEVQFIIDPVEIPENELETLLASAKPDSAEWDVKKELGKLKQERTQFWIEEIPKVLSDFSQNPDTVVTPELIQLTYDPEGKVPTQQEVFNDLQLPEDSLSKFWEQKGKHAGLIFTPHRGWYFGVTDKYKDHSDGLGVCDFLNSHLPGLRYGTFMGTNEEEGHEISKLVEEDNINNQERFLDNKIDIMVSTKAFGMGIDKPNIRFTIHNNYPESIESFVQEAGRSGRDKKMAVSVILFNDQLFPLEKNPAYQPDFSIQEFFHHNSFKGTWKEKAMLYELLHRISFPPTSQKKTLIIKLGEKIGKDAADIDFKLSYSNEHHCIWLNDHDKQKYGVYDLKEYNGERGRLWTGNNDITVDEKTALRYLSNLGEILKEYQVHDYTHDQFKTWINSTTAIPQEDGIEVRLSKIAEGQELRITIPFANDREFCIQNITKIAAEIDPQINAYVTNHNFDTDPTIFLEKISRHLRWKEPWQEKLKKAAEAAGISEQQLLNRLSFRLNSLRTKGDTEKALYRLSLIGLIDEYTVDFRTETYDVYCTKKTDKAYRDHLTFYLRKFYSDRKVQQILTGIDDRPGETLIQRMLNFLVEFVYEEIAKKRYESIKSMRELCRMGVTEGNIEIKSWIHLYFNSKYARKGYRLTLDKETVTTEYRSLQEREEDQDEYNVSLLDWSEEGRLASVDWIFDFIQITLDDYNNAQMDNLKHLRGACTRLIIINPDNYCFRLLRAYAQIMLAERLRNEQIPRERIYEDLQKGFEQLGKDLPSLLKSFL